MIYVCVPVHNEAPTAGLVLRKVRQVFTTFPREYQILACDDASTDDTADVPARYARVLPMTVITHRERQGYARSLEELLRLYQQAEQLIVDDAAVLFTTHSLSHVLVKPYLQGYVLTPIDVPLERYLSITADKMK